MSPTRAFAHTATVVAVAILAASGSWLAASPARAASDGLEDTLVISVRGGATQKAFEKLDKMFQDRFGVKVSNVIDTSGPAYASLRASTRSPAIDVLQTTLPTQVQGEADGVYAKNDPAIVTNIKNADPQFVDKAGYGVPWGTTVAGIEYNADIYAKNHIPVPTSWNDLLAPQVKGHMGQETMTITFGQDVIVALSRSNGTTEHNPDAAFKRIAALGPNIVIYKSPSDLDNYFQQGAVWVAMNGLPNYLALKQSGFPVKMAYPKEGPVSVGATSMTAVANARHPKAAQAFLNFLLTPEAQQVVAEAALVPSIKNLKLPADVAANLPTDDQMKKLINPDSDYINSVLDDWTARANREWGQ